MNHAGKRVPLNPSIEITTLRLWRKSPGSARLRKNSAASLNHLLASGWRETQRNEGPEEVVVRLERPTNAEPFVNPHKGDSSPFRREKKSS